MKRFVFGLCVVLVFGFVCLAGPLDPVEVQPSRSYQVVTLKGVVFITEVKIDGCEYLILNDSYMLPKTLNYRIVGGERK